MIAHIDGNIIEKQLHTIVVKTHGVGYAVGVADTRIYSTGQTVALYIHSYWHQDQGPVLYGFTTPAERSAFQAVISCSGCGPKLGLAVLNAMAPHQFFQVISRADKAALSKVSGIGPKKAELIIMQLKDKIVQFAHEEIYPAHAAHKNTLTKLSQALSALHYTQKEIEHALDFLVKDDTMEGCAFDELVKRALSVLSKRL